MKKTTSARLLRRLQAVRLAAEGRAAREIAATVGASRRSVTYWLAAYRAGCARRRLPAEVLAPKVHRGRVPLLPELTRERLLAEVERDPLALGYAATGWTVALLAAHLRQRCGLPVNAHTLRRRLRACGLRWKRPRYGFAPPDPARAQKKAGWCAA